MQKGKKKVRSAAGRKERRKTSKELKSKEGLIVTKRKEVRR